MTGRQDLMSVTHPPSVSSSRKWQKIATSENFCGNPWLERRQSFGNDCEGQNHNDNLCSGHGQSQGVGAEICSEYGWGGEEPSLSPCSLVCAGVICVLVPCPWLMCHCCVCHYLMWRYRMLDTFYLCDTLLSTQTLKELVWATGLTLGSHIDSKPCCTGSALGGLNWDVREMQRSAWGLGNISCRTRWRK